MSSIWNTFIYTPLYNILIAIVAFIPGHSVGLAIIILTLLVKFALLPLTIRSSKAQRAMKLLDPKLRELREKYKDDRQQLSLKTMELYRNEGVNPFSGCLPVIVQLPFVIALYFLIVKGLHLNTEMLYSYIPKPDHLNLTFFGADLASKSIVFALLAGVTQYLQTKYLIPNPKELFKKQENKEVSMQDEFAKSMNIQMLFVFPVLIAFISYTTSLAVALYFITSNIVGIAQEQYLRRTGNK